MDKLPLNINKEVMINIIVGFMAQDNVLEDIHSDKEKIKNYIAANLPKIIEEYVRLEKEFLDKMISPEALPYLTDYFVSILS